MKVGCRIKQFRSGRRLTLKSLSKRTGLTISFLSQLERDLTSPSVVSLERIAQALNVNIADFFKPPQQELIVVKEGAGKTVTDTKQGVLVEALASGIFNVNIQSCLLTLNPGVQVNNNYLPSQGEKFVMVLKGMIEFFNGTEKISFREGDSMYCSYSRKLQTISNCGDTEAKVLYISFLPA